VHGFWPVDSVKRPAVLARDVPQPLGRVVTRHAQRLPNQERKHANAHVRVALTHQREIVAHVATIGNPQENLRVYVCVCVCVVTHAKKSFEYNCDDSGEMQRHSHACCNST
jgi:hypothetical protein